MQLIRSLGGTPVLCRWLTGLVLITGVFGGSLHGQEATAVRDLKRHFGSKYKNEVVTVRGHVQVERRVRSRTFRAYYIKDRYGDLIMVRTTRELPPILAEVQVTGVALRDADTGGVYVSENNRTVLAAPLGAGGGGTPAPSLPATKKQKQDREKEQRIRGIVQGVESAISAGDWNLAESRLDNLVSEDPGNSRISSLGRAIREGRDNQQMQYYVLFGIGAIVVILIGVAVFLMRRKPELPAPIPPPPAPVPGPEPFPADDKTRKIDPGGFGATSMVDDFNTVKVYKTTKVLPGQLLVMDNKQETDTIFLSDQSGRGEIEIGRDSPDVQGGIRIKDSTNTLSRRQARIIYSASAREFKLLNLAGQASNPTIVNGREMSESEAVVLNNGDILTMGNLEMKFRKK